MKQSGFMTLAVAALLGASSCSNEDLAMVVNDKQPLNIQNVDLSKINTKAGITATAFTNNEKIGLYIYRGTNLQDAAEYNDATSKIPTRNVAYNATTKAALSQGIVLSNVKGNVFSYYPYSETNTSNDGKTIPVTVADAQGTGQSDGTKDVAEQTDYMWGDPIKNISNAQPNVNIKMNHALAMVSFKFKQTDKVGIKYPGEGKVSSIVLKNKATQKVVKSGAATMNIETGVITGGVASANGISLKPNANTTLMDVTTPSKLPRLLLYPVASIADLDAEVTLTIDGNKYTVPIPAIPSGYKAGNNYEYTFTMTGTDMVITSVAVKNWITNNIDGGIIQTPDLP